MLSNEAKIGTLVLAVIAILGVITWQAGNFDFNPQGYELKVRMKNIDGVELNSPVTLNGFEVGRVTAINIIYGEETFVEMTLWLRQEAKIHVGTEAFIKNMGFLGEKYVGLTTGNDWEPFLPPGTVVEGREPGSFEKILSDGQDIARNLKEISAEINERLKVNSDSIDDVMENLRVSMRNIAQISGNVNERLETNKVLIDDTMKHVNAASLNLEEMSFDLKHNPWKLLYRPKKETRAELQEVTTP